MARERGEGRGGRGGEEGEKEEEEEEADEDAEVVHSFGGVSESKRLHEGGVRGWEKPRVWR